MKRLKKFLIALTSLFSVVALFPLSACGGAMHTLTIINENEDGGTLLGEGRYKTGSTVGVSAKANKEYKFSSWNIEDEIIKTSNGTYSFKMPNKDLTIYGSFEYKSFQVTTSVPVYSYVVASISGEGTYKVHDAVTINVTFNEADYEVDEWTVNDEIVMGSNNSLTFEMPLKKVKVGIRIDHRKVNAYFTSNIEGFSGYYTCPEGASCKMYANMNNSMTTISHTDDEGLINPNTGRRMAVEKIDQVTSDGEFIENNHTYRSVYDNPYIFNFNPGNDDVYFHIIFRDFVSYMYSSVGNGGIICNYFSDTTYGQWLVFVGTEITFHSCAYDKSSFYGWYIDDVLYSSEDTISIVLTENLNLVAKYSD